MLRTSIQFTGFFLTLVSAFFLIKGTITLSALDIAKITQTGFLFYNKDVVCNLAGQRADTLVGFIILLIGFVLQMAVIFWEEKWGVFTANKKGVVISIIVCFLILFSGWYFSNFLRDRTSKKVFEIHKVLQK